MSKKKLAKAELSFRGNCEALESGGFFVVF